MKENCNCSLALLYQHSIKCINFVCVNVRPIAMLPFCFIFDNINIKINTEF